MVKLREVFGQNDSLRVDILAKEFNGGGHACAAGFNVEGSIEVFYPNLIDAIGKHLELTGKYKGRMSTRQDVDFEGILLVDKPQGITSHDVVDRLRRKLRMKKIGHAGTLDPLATGLLIMLVGKATKVSQFLISLDKAYEGTFLLGVETDSQDADGEVVTEKPCLKDCQKNN